MDRRALLAGSAAGLWAASARAQQACFDRLDCFDTQLPGPSLDLQFTGGSLDPRITFTRASVATYFDVAGTLQSAASGAPRFDYDPVTHAPRGLLIEEARTNLLLNSATLGTQSVTTAATPYTLSFYGSGTVTLTGTSTAGPLTGSGAFPQRVSLTFTPTAGTLTLTVSGSVLNANLEAGSFATSAIVTAGASATRAADVATMPLGSWFNVSAGTLEIEFDTSLPTSVSVVGGFTDGTFGNTFYFGSSGGNVLTISGPGVNLSKAGIAASGLTNKAAASYTASIAVVAINGASATGVAGSPPFPWSTTLVIGSSPWGPGANVTDGHYRRVRYWRRALAAGEMQAVTQ